MASVTIAGLTKTYLAGAGAAALADLDLAIGDNEFITLLGPSGCGKTTTLRLIAGYMAPDAGTIHVGGRLVSSRAQVVPPEDRGMGMVFQNYAVWPHKTVFENVVFGLRVRRVAAAAAREQVGRALALVNLVGYEDRLPGELSGGQQQRVALARSLVVEPEILLLDEPLSNLDAKLRERMRSELKQLQRRTGITFIYVTHDQAEALALSDHIAVMHGGRLEQFGTPDDVYRRPASRTVADFMGHVNFVAGQLTALERDHATVMVAGTLAISAAAPPGAKVGDAVDVAVRPEDMRIGPGDAGAVEGIPAQLTDRTYLGNLIEYQALLASGETVRVQTHPSAQFSVGEKIKVDMARAHLNVFARGEDRTATGTSDRE